MSNQGSVFPPGYIRPPDNVVEILSSKKQRKEDDDSDTQLARTKSMLSFQAFQLGERIVPNACRSIAHKNECKHEFPKDSKMNTGRAFLVCKGIAKDRHFKRTGSRNMIGTILGRRNSPWLNGTAPGLCVGMTGSNTDVKLNDRLPILDGTHEDLECKHHCVPKTERRRQRATRRMTRRLQATQAQINGYFGGYISKRQKIGNLEARKCIDKMYVLRERKANESDLQKRRAVSGRMVTDIEMNGTLRGAVEE